MRKNGVGLLMQTLLIVPGVAVAQTTTTPTSPPLSPPTSPAASMPPGPSASSPAATTLNVVTVTGIRAAARNALEAKEASNEMVEVISSEDIGKLPDTTIAESLARLPGLSAGYDRGNASQVVARGLGPRFVGATLNGREFASTEPDRAVRFEMFPSESVSGATIYKTQSADLVEGGIATTIDLQTVQPLAYKERQLSLKADALYYQMGSDIQGAKKYAPRLGGIYVDQFADHTLGVAIAASYYDQPSLEDRVDNWGFNSLANSAALPGSSTVDLTPWGFQNGVKTGTDKRSSVLGKLQYKPNDDVNITADVYSAISNIYEPTVYHVESNLGNWDGGQSADFSNYTVSNGYVTGATVTDADLNTIEALWKQNMRNFATGLNGKFKVGDWKFEGDIAGSTAVRNTFWSAVQMSMLQPGTVTWNFPQNQWMTYSFNEDTGNPNNYANSVSEAWGPTYTGYLHDMLNSQMFTATRSLNWGDVSDIHFGLRATQREKYYNQISWDYGTATLPTSAFQRMTVSGRPDFIDLVGGFSSAVSQYFGSSVLSAAGRTATNNDLVANDWRAKENSGALFAQADLRGDAFGDLSYRGNVGLRVAHTEQTGYGDQQLNGGTPTPVSDGTSYTRFLPSLNMILNLDPDNVNQLRLGLSRAMSRAPLDVMNDAHVVTVDPTGATPTTVAGGNPHLLPMMANQVDLAFERYFGKDSYASAGLFYKQISDYIGISSVAGTYNGAPAYYTQQVNRQGGEASGFELIYQQAYTWLPAPWNGLGLMANYTYTSSNIKENGDPSGASFIPIPANGLMRSNGGFTLWYERNGFEARLAANYHSAYNRAPTWVSTAFQINGPETWVSMNLAQRITSNLQLRFGIENLTNQRVTYTNPLVPYYQSDFEFGRRFNIGLSYKL